MPPAHWRICCPLLAALASPPCHAFEPDPESTALADWIRDGGGFVDPRQVVRNAQPGNSSTVRGVFAAAPIAAGSLLLRLPWELILAPEEDDGTQYCSTVSTVRRELATGPEGSRFGLYLASLQRAQPSMPAAWDEEARALLARLLGQQLPVEAQRSHLRWWAQSCGGDPDSDPLGAAALFATVTRSLQPDPAPGGGNAPVLVPYFTFYNHRNGRWLNTHLVSTFGKPLEVSASRDIAEGEQLYLSYGKRTLRMLNDYGFVEDVPQVWSFTIGDRPNNNTTCEFEVDADSQGEEGSLSVTWASAEPPAACVEWLRGELERMRLAEASEQAYATQLANRSATSAGHVALIWQYFSAQRRAIFAALQGADRQHTGSRVCGADL